MSAPQGGKARQETGGPSRYGNQAARGHAEASDIEARIGALEALTTGELRTEWQRLYRVTPPTRLSRDLLLRGIVNRVQERAYGGLSLSTKRQLRALSEGFDERASAPQSITLKAGTKLAREWHRQVHIVNVLDDGFEYQGERYPSLTRIARQITGVAWSGPRFFGIDKTARGSRGGA